MALVERFERFERKSMERNSVHEPIDAKFTSFDSGEQRYLQIDTYGRATREMPGKLSQTIQLNKQSAQELIAIIRQEFNL
jgi:hypothetical protein